MIPVCTPLLSGREKEYVNDCLRTNWISSAGKYVQLFEERFSRYCGARYGIATTNGTTALHLALAAVGIGKGDEVIMPTFTIASPAFAAIYCGAKPVFVDSEPDTWNINPQKIEQTITKKTKAIIPVHIYGHPCDMAAIMRIARKYGLLVIEDAAEAHGAEYKGKKAGGIGHMGCFSFYGNKIITCGEGGMVVTGIKKIADRCRRLKDLGFLRERRYWHEELAFNYRMTNIQAALGLAQFEKIDQYIKMRRDNAFRYNALLKNIPGIVLPVERPDVKNVYWMYGIILEKELKISARALMETLRTKGVETRTFFLPLHNQPVFKKLGCASRARYLVAETIAARGLYLPSGSGLKKTESVYICECIREAVR
jgi:perosamine synthetase